jgi:hypothetical protein
MTIYKDASAVKASKRRSLILTIAGGTTALLMTGGAAYAYMTLTGEGSAQADAYVATPLGVSDAHVVGKLFPGATRNFKFTVSNDNEFPVKVTKIEATGGPTNITSGCNVSHITTTLTGASGGAYTLTAAQAEVVPAGGQKVIEIANAVSYSTAATVGCGFKLPIQVTGVQSGN